MEDTGARGSQEEQEGEAPKRVIFSDDDERDEVKVEPELADTDVAQSGSAHGAAAQGDKRKRERKAMSETEAWTSTRSQKSRA